MEYKYQVKLVRIVDGDTIYLEVDLGFRVKLTLDFRLAGINTPEVVGTTRTAGLEAKAELERLTALGPLRAVTTKPDKYGRWLVTLFVCPPDGVEICINEALVSGGFAIPYMVQG